MGVGDYSGWGVGVGGRVQSTSGWVMTVGGVREWVEGYSQGVSGATIMGGT